MLHTSIVPNPLIQNTQELALAENTLTQELKDAETVITIPIIQSITYEPKISHNTREKNRLL